MKSLRLGFVFASLAGVVTACGGAVEAAPRTDPAVVSIEPPPPGGDGPVPPPVKKSCPRPVPPPTCNSSTPAPTTEAALATFFEDIAIPLRCASGGERPVWDVEPIVDLYGSNKMFMMGEVHGSNEIGIVSSVIFERLASAGLVNVLAYEMPMDLEEPLQHYVDTGSDDVVGTIVDHGAPNFFGTILTKDARAQVKRGTPIRIGAVDIPMESAFAASAIKDVASRLTTTKMTVLETLPTASSPPIATDYAKANAYFDHIMTAKTEICAELSEADCDRLVAMTHALWATTTVADRGTGVDSALWFDRREVAIYYNLRMKMAGAGDRMFLHMGAAHVNKWTFSAGSKMAMEFPGTKGQVFSIGPANGNGSVIAYAGEMHLPARPKTLATALGDAPAQPVFVSTTAKGRACQQNPLGLELETDVGGDGGTHAQLFDGYIHYGKLTSEDRPKDSGLTRDLRGRRLDDFRARIARRERNALLPTR
jgi:hypothetical protein